MVFDLKKESKTNPDIDKEKSRLNYDLHNQQLQDENWFIKIGHKLDKALDFLEKIDKMDEFKDFEKQKKQMEIVKKMDMEI